MSPNDLHKELEKGKFRPVYYFHGAEDFRIKEAEKALVGKFLPKPQQKTNHSVLSASKQKLEDILTELSIVPMLGERQMFTIHDIQSLNQKTIDRILALIDPPDPNRVVIFTSPSTKVPRKTTALYKYLSSKAAPVEFPKLRRDSAASRVRSQLKAQKIEIDNDAINLLIELIGGDFSGLSTEIGKLADFAGEGGKITVETVSEVCSDYQVFKIYELAQHVVTNKLDKALSVIDFLVNKGESPSLISYFFGEHFLGLYLTQNGKKLGKQDVSWKFRGQINLFSNSQLEDIIRMIAEADMELRQEFKTERLVLEELIFRISQVRKK